MPVLKLIVSDKLLFRSPWRCYTCTETCGR